MPEADELTEFEDLIKVARLIDFLSKAKNDEQTSFLVMFKSKRLAEGNGRFNAQFPKVVLDCVQTICSADHIAKYCAIEIGTRVTLSELVNQSLYFNLIAGIIAGESAHMVVTFQCNKAGCDYEKTFLTPQVYVLLVGGFRLIFLVAIFGTGNIEDIEDVDDEIIGVKMYPCNALIYKYYKFDVNSVVPLTISDYRAEICNHFKETHNVILDE